MAVADLSFRVEAGTILGLIGPNGAGKTTTLRAIAGIIPPTRGRLSVAGHNLATEPVQAKQQLARGMRQKVAICCAYLHDPRALLFDEPLTGLDPQGIRTLKQSIRERAR